MNLNQQKKIMLAILLTSSYTVSYAQSTEMNYVQTKTFLDESGTTFLRHIDYYDELGHVLETVDVGLNTSGTPVVSRMEYDTRLKLECQWLPTPSSGLEFIKDVSDMASNTYDDGLPYSINEYDDFQELTSSWKPGESWEEHNVATTRSVVPGGEVKKYSVNGNGELCVNGTYPYGILTCTTATDEDGHKTSVYANMHGETILERRFENNDDDNDAYDTYYVYDTYGRLRYVLPPMCQHCETSMMSKHWYKYSYDDRGRCIDKQLPGCDSIVYRYDYANRPLIFQDGLLREKGLYRYTLYDNLGRIAIQGTCASFDEDKLNSNLFVTFHPEAQGLLGSGYAYVDDAAASGFVSGITLEAAYYYDGYGFLNQTNNNTKYRNFAKINELRPSNATMITGNNASNAVGNKTGEIIATTAGGFLYNSFFYDSKGRLIEDHHSTLTGDVYKVFTDYSFTNKPTQVVKVVPTDDGNTAITTSYAYNSNNDQPESVSIQYGGNATPVIVSQISYDDLGRIASNNRPQINDRIDYSYNIQGWTTGITGSHFSEHLFYEDGPLTKVPCWNGNISSMTWQASDGVGRGYYFKYNSRDQLYEAGYRSGNDNFSDNGNEANRYNESVTAFTPNGAIESLQRRGKNNSNAYTDIDLLHYTYDGQKVQNITDACNSRLSYTGAFEYVDGHVGSVTSPDFEYNSAGMLTKDRDKGITRITYNNIGLVDSILFDTGAKVLYTYGINGEKLRVRHFAATSNMVSPLSHSPFPPISAGIDNSSYDEEEYIGGDFVVYGSVSRGASVVPSYKYYFGDGYISQDPVFLIGSGSTASYHYYSKDHLGNVRSVVTKSTFTNTVTEEQKTHYYPFGGIIADLSTGRSVQNRLYNGKELDTSNNLWWYDYGARQYDPTAPRFNSPDKFSEKYYSTNIYTYGANNPIMYIDINGDSLAVNGELSDLNKTAETMTMYGKNKYKYENGQIMIAEKADNPNGYDRYYSMVIDDKAITTINVVNNSKEVVIADGNSATIDIGDIKKIGDHGFVTSGSVIGHEILEQYYMQVKGCTINNAHLYASSKEQGMTRSDFYIPHNQRNLTKNSITFEAVKGIDNTITETIKFNITHGNIK